MSYNLVSNYEHNILYYKQLIINTLFSVNRGYMFGLRSKIMC